MARAQRRDEVGALNQVQSITSRSNLQTLCVARAKVSWSREPGLQCCSSAMLAGVLAAAHSEVRAFTVGACVTKRSGKRCNKGPQT
eukprot:5157880-Amphidinium_carterae.1